MTLNYLQRVMRVNQQGCVALKFTVDEARPLECLAIRGDQMPKHDHHKAAEHHEEAAKSHRKAADAHDKGQHADASQHSQIAHDHSSKAHEASKSAHEKTKGPKKL